MVPPGAYAHQGPGESVTVRVLLVPQLFHIYQLAAVDSPEFVVPVVAVGGFAAAVLTLVFVAQEAPPDG